MLKCAEPLGSRESPLSLVPTLKTTSADPSCSRGGGSHVCLLLPSARLFVCPVLSVSTLALHFCVGVESDPHLPGLFFFFSLSPFSFSSRAAEFESQAKYTCSFIKRGRPQSRGRQWEKK